MDPSLEIFVIGALCFIVPATIGAGRHASSISFIDENAVCFTRYVLLSVFWQSQHCRYCFSGRNGH